MDDKTVSAPARAKVNLFLEVTRKRADGCHDIDSVFLEISLADTLRARPAAPGRIALTCNDPSLPTDGRNLALRAALDLREYFLRTRGRDVPCGLELRLEKRIPPGGGLGGGSSDAATALRLADAVWGCGMDEEELSALAAELGADVPFFLRGGLCRCRGRGEIIEPLPPFPEERELGLALPPVHSSTATAYAGLGLAASGSSPAGARSADAFIAALCGGKAGSGGDLLRGFAFNRFEESVFRDIPPLGALHAELEGLLGHSARLSGSGSSFWFFAEKEWESSAALAKWGRAKGVRLLSCRAAGAAGQEARCENCLR